MVQTEEQKVIITGHPAPSTSTTSMSKQTHYRKLPEQLRTARNRAAAGRECRGQGEWRAPRSLKFTAQQKPGIEWETGKCSEEEAPALRGPLPSTPAWLCFHALYSGPLHPRSLTLLLAIETSSHFTEMLRLP